MNINVAFVSFQSETPSQRILSDNRIWTDFHIRAADAMPNPHIMPFTPPRGDDPVDRNINTPGPGTYGVHM